MADPVRVTPSDSGWDAARREALAPYVAERQRLTDAIGAIDASGDTSDAAAALRQRLENDRAILDVDVRTMQPPAITDSGQFEAGDLRSYLDGLGPGGGPSFDDLTPDQQFAYIRDNAPGYQEMMAQDTAMRAGQAAIPGAAGAAYGQLLAMGASTPWMGPRGGARRGPSACQTCRPRVPNEPYVTLYRGIQVRRGEPVQGHFGNSQSGGGQMGSTDPRDALHYGINPPGNRPPPDANELVVIRVRVPRRLVDTGGASAAGPGETEHLIIPREVDIRSLPGYRETRIPLREIASAPQGDNQRRELVPGADAYWARRLSQP